MQELVRIGSPGYMAGLQVSSGFQIHLKRECEEEDNVLIIRIGSLSF